MAELKREPFIERRAEITRRGSVDEVTKSDGSIRYHVQVRDPDRSNPFISKWFNDPVPAADFLDRVMPPELSWGSRHSQALVVDYCHSYDPETGTCRHTRKEI